MKGVVGDGITCRGVEGEVVPEGGIRDRIVDPSLVLAPAHKGKHNHQQQ